MGVFEPVCPKRVRRRVGSGVLSGGLRVRCRGRRGLEATEFRLEARYRRVARHDLGVELLRQHLREQVRPPLQQRGQIAASGFDLTEPQAGPVGA